MTTMLLASEGGGLGIADIVSNVPQVFNFATAILNGIFSNPILAFIFCVGIFGLGLAVVRKLFNTVSHLAR